MSVSSRRKAPVLRVHAPSSQAYIFVGGKRLYLGRHDLPETVQKYHQVVAELMASGGQLPVEREAIRIKELIARFWVWSQGYYVRATASQPRSWTTSARRCARSRRCTPTRPSPASARAP